MTVHLSPVRPGAADDRFPFLGVSTPDGWDDWFRYGVERGEDGLGLLTDDVPTYRDARVVVGVDNGVRVVDVAVDDCGLVYVLDETGAIHQYDPDREMLSRFSCLWRGEPPGEPRAICVTPDDIYVASTVPGAGANPGTGSRASDVTTTGRVHALSRHRLATRWFAMEPFVRPKRIVATDDEVYVLDDGPEEETGGDGNGNGFLARLGTDGRAELLLEGLEAADVTVDDAGRLALLDVSEVGPAVLVYDPPASADPDAGDALVLPEREDERLPPTAFEVVGGTTLDPTCLAVGPPTHAVVGVGPEFPGERLLYRYVARDGAFERLPSFPHSCVRLVLSPPRRSCENDATGDGTRPDEADGDRNDAAESRTPRRLYAVDGNTRSLYVLDRGTRNRTSLGGVGPYAGRVVGRLDAGEPGTVWHRVTADAHLGGPGTQVQLRYYATDESEVALEGPQVISGIGPTFAERLRSANVLGVGGLAALDPETIATAAATSVSRTRRWVEPARELVGLWSLPERSTADVLLTDAVGRYLWVELTLLGDEFDTPRVGTLKAYFPRRSYLRYLPAIYREDEASAAFLERFLSLFESTYVDVDEALAGFTRYLEPTGVPGEYLTWLGGWLAVAQDESWPTAARRTLLAEAPSLFRMRGTEAGLRRVLDILLAEVDPPTRDWETARDHEADLLERWVEAGYLTAGERAAMLAAYDDLVASDPDARSPLYAVWTHAVLDCVDPDAADLVALYRRLVACPQCFIVLVRPVLTDEELRTVRRVVETWTPAHATGRAVELRSGIRLDTNSFLGVNTTLVEPSFVLGESLLGTDTVLGQRDPAAQLDLSRFGEEARMT